MRAQAWRYELDDDELIERLGSMSCAYGRWDRAFSAWIVGAGGARGVLTPTWTIVAPDGEPTCLEAVARAARGLFTWPGVAWLDADETAHAVAAVREYVEIIPAELRRAVGPLGDAQWVTLELAAQVPAFAALLVSDRDTWGQRFVSACFTFATPERLSKERRVELAKAIASEGRRELLGRLSGTEWPAAAVRALARLEGEWSASDLDALALRCIDPQQVRSFAHARSITLDMLGVRWLRPWLDGDRSALGLLDWDGAGLPPISDELTTRIAASLRSAASDEQLLRLAAKWRRRVLIAAPFPPPPFPGG